VATNRTALRIAAAALLAAPCAWAFPPAATKLTCDGKYSRYEKPTTETTLRGIYLDVSANRIRIDGAAGFDGAYLVSQTDERTVGFVKEGDLSSRGVLNRLNGDLTLTQAKERPHATLPGDPKGRVQGIFAECKIAKHMF
jgi:hypothetical protein